MRSQSRSALSVLVFLVPLLGVPLMAIFGVPQFVPVIASSVSDEVAHPTKTRRSQGVGESAAATSFVSEPALRESGSRPDDRLHDLFRPTKSSPRDSRPLRGDLFSRSHAPRGNVGVDAPRRSGDPSLEIFTTDDDAERRDSRSHAERGNETGLTWREAVRRLNELGIQDFRLEPGRQLGEFYFACEFTPDRDARITRRFEAEAQEPLLAVAAVLRQIDEWQSRR